MYLLLKYKFLNNITYQFTTKQENAYLIWEVFLFEQHNSY